MWGSQERILSLSKNLQQEILPTSSLIDKSRRELDLQIHEIKLLVSFDKSNSESNLKIELLRLGPAVRSLMMLVDAPQIPEFIRSSLEDWRDKAADYQKLINNEKKLSIILVALEKLRDQSDLIHRRLQREFSIQLLELSQNTTHYFVFWTIAFGLSLLFSLLLLFFLWKWFQPISMLQEWFEQKDFSRWAPTSVRSQGLLSAPYEIQNLVEAVREHILNFQQFANDAESRLERAQDLEKSVGTLMTALYNLSRKNEDLIKELINKERLASMGEMAAQLAHEIRNPLNSLSLKLELFKDCDPERKDKLMNDMGRELDRLDALTESYLRKTKATLNNSETPVVESAFSPLQKSVEQSLELFETEVKELNIQLSQSFPDVEITAKLPPSVLKAALINIIKNAKEAIRPDSLNRKIHIESTFDSKNWSIKVFDSGEGFDSHYLAKPFSIFQSTKKEGSGLGLYTSKKMLEAYGIQILISKAQSPFQTLVEIKGPLSEQSTLDGIARESEKGLNP
jgi:signal transduction histidine kinase